MEENVKREVCLAFKRDLERFAESVCELIQNSELFVQREFLKKIARNAGCLYKSSIQVQKIRGADKDAGEIGAVVQNIFVKPLAVRMDEHVSIKKAVESFDPEPEREQETDLFYIMREYSAHPESTKNFARELELLSDEVDVILRHIA